MRTVLVRALTATLAVAALGACGADARPSARGNGGAPGAADAARPSAQSGTATTAPAAPRETPGSIERTATPVAPRATGAPRAGGATPSGRAPAAGADVFPLSGVVTPACVAAGGVATITINTVTNANAAYVAMYAGDKSGAQPPFGYGYGGNEHGKPDYRGTWTSSWTVRADAPVGKGRVVVVVVKPSGEQKEIDVPFTVGEREAGGCGT